MKVLIVESNVKLAELWAKPLLAHSHSVTLAQSQSEAMDHLHQNEVDVMILDLNLGQDIALALADFVSYRHPNTQIVAITRECYFSDGSIFQYMGNARAIVPTSTSPQDLSMMIEHYHALAH